MRTGLQDTSNWVLWITSTRKERGKRHQVVVELIRRRPSLSLIDKGGWAGENDEVESRENRQSYINNRDSATHTREVF